MEQPLSNQRKKKVNGALLIGEGRVAISPAKGRGLGVCRLAVSLTFYLATKQLDPGQLVPVGYLFSSVQA